MIKTPKQLMDEIEQLVSIPAYPSEPVNIQREHYKAYKFLQDNQFRLYDALRCLDMTIERLEQPQEKGD